MQYILKHPSLGNVKSIDLQINRDDYHLKVNFTEDTWDLVKFDEEEAKTLAKMLQLEAVQEVRYFIAGKTFAPKRVHYLLIAPENSNSILHSWVKSESNATYFNSEYDAESVLRTLELTKSLPTNFNVACAVYSTNDYLD